MKAGKILSMILVLAVMFTVYGQLIEVEASIVDDSYTFTLLPEGEYDELINIAESDFTTSYDSWYYKPTGRYVGSLLPESRAEIQNVIGSTYMYTTFVQETIFDGQDVLDGISEFWIRFPVDMNLTHGFTFQIYAEYTELEYDINEQGELDFHNTSMLVFDSLYTYADDDFTGSGDVNPDYYRANGRGYMRVNCPIYPNIRYVFIFVGECYPNPATGRVPFYYHYSYMNSEDYSKSVIYQYNYFYDSHDYVFSSKLALGFSFLFTKGIGGYVISRDYELDSGNFFQFRCSIDNISQSDIQDNLTIKIPFISEEMVSGSIDIYYYNVNGTDNYHGSFSNVRGAIEFTTGEFDNDIPLMEDPFLITFYIMHGYTETFSLILGNLGNIAYNWRANPSVDTSDFITSYRPDNCYCLESRLYWTDKDLDNFRYSGFAPFFFLGVVDQNGTYLLNQPETGQTTKGVYAFYKTYFPQQPNDDFADTWLFRGIKSVIHKYDDLQDWVYENDDALDVIPYYAEKTESYQDDVDSAVWMVDQYSDDPMFRYGVNYLIGNPFEALVIYRANRTGGLIELSNWALSHSSSWEGAPHFTNDDDKYPPGPLNDILEELDNAIETIHSVFAHVKKVINDTAQALLKFAEDTLYAIYNYTSAWCGLISLVVVGAVYWAGARGIDKVFEFVTKRKVS